MHGNASAEARATLIQGVCPLGVLMIRDGKLPLLHNVPVRLSSFIGRVQDSAEVAQLLAISRLVTLTGAGGCGKTRLAEHVARATAERYADGLRFSALAALSDPSLVPGAVAVALGLPEQLGRPLTDTLVEHLRPRQALLVLDNCEHVIDACAQLVTLLLNTCPELRILTTSREPLNIDGEFIWNVPSLSVPESATPLSRLRQFDAVRLFCERAATSGNFELTSQNGESIAHICRRLDGIPLAIELAAARVKVLRVEQLAARLDDALRLLSEGKRGAPPRHQTLRATLDWSYLLLATEEQLLCRRLAVFAGDFSADAAESVCAFENERAEGLDRDDVFDLLSHLVNKSLVLVSLPSDSGSAARYRLLETVRQYGRERLREAGELPQALRSHAQYYLDLAEVEWPELLGTQQTDWLAQMETEHDNLRAALDWSYSAMGDPALGLRLAAALCWFWWTHGLHSEAQKWLTRALAASAESPTRARAQALCWAGIVGAGDQDYLQAAAYLEESLALGETLRDQGEMSWALVNMARLAEYTGDAERATLLAERGVSLSRDLGHPWYIAHALERFGETLRLQGDFARALALYEESLTLSRARGDKRNAATVLHNLGHVALHQGSLHHAATYFAESLALAEEIGDERRIVMCIEGLASVSEQADLLQEAETLFGVAQILRSRLGIPFEAADLIVYRHHLAKLRGAPDQAALRGAWVDGERMSQPEAIRYALDVCSRLAAGQPVSARGVTKRYKRGTRQEFGGLTPREREVASFIVQGRTNRQIASALVISERTVDKHVAQILSKLGFHSRAQVAAWAIEQELGNRLVER